MTSADQQRFGEGLLALGIAFRTEITDDLMAAFAAGLDDVLIDHLVWAMREAMKRSEYFPSVATLRTLADRARLLEDDQATYGDQRCLNPGEEEREEFERGPGRLVVCPKCDDSGFERQTCTEDNPCGNRLCGAQASHGHVFVTPCSCRETNVNFLRRMRPRNTYRKEV